MHQGKTRGWPRYRTWSGQVPTVVALALRGDSWAAESASWSFLPRCPPVAPLFGTECQTLGPAPACAGNSPIPPRPLCGCRGHRRPGDPAASPRSLCEPLLPNDISPEGPGHLDPTTPLRVPERPDRGLRQAGEQATHHTSCSEHGDGGQERWEWRRAEQDGSVVR